MKHYGLNIAEGTEITNITIPTGTAFPSNDNVGELFFKTDENKFYLRDNTTWVEVGSGGGGSAAGSDTQVQFNSSNAFAADADFTYNSTSNALTLGSVLAGDGAEATPSYSFASDTDTGMYFQTNKVSFTTAGTKVVELGQDAINLYKSGDVSPLVLTKQSGVGYLGTIGGNLRLIGGSSTTFTGRSYMDLVNGGGVELHGSDASGTNNAADINIIAGDGGTTSGDGGDINLTGGDETSGTGGNINITAGGDSVTPGTVNVVGRLNVANVAGGNTPTVSINGPVPTLRINRTGASTDNGNWAIQDAGAGYLQFVAVSDNESSASTWLRVHRASGQGPTHLETFDPFRGQNGSSGQPIYSFTNSAGDGLFYDSTAGSDGAAISNSTAGRVTFTANGMRLQAVNAPSNEISGYAYLYVDGIDDDLKYRDDSGTVVTLSTTELSLDATPQLGGTLESNGNNITIATGDIITITDAPTNATDGTNKAYVDSISAGLDPKMSVRVATTAALPAVTGAGSGVGKTLTANAVGIVAIDGQDITAANSFAVNDRILIKDQVNAADNGIYTVTTLSAAGTALVLTRATDFDGTPSNEVSGGNYTFAEIGTTNADTGWVVTSDGDLILDTDDINWSQYTGAGSFTAGLGLDQTGSTIFVKSSELASATITTADTVAFFDNDGSTSSTDAGDRKTTVSNFISDLNIVTGSAIANVVEDLTPQLGGILDVNGFDIIGKAAATVTSNGGPIDLVGAAGGATSGTGGIINITSGSAIGTDSSGGALNVVSGSGTGTGIGGDIKLETGDGTTGGAIRLNGGDSISAFNNQGGRIVITGGKGGSTIGSGGDIALKGGDTGTAGTGQGGFVSIDTGKSGASGQIRFLEDVGVQYVGLQSPVAVTTSRDWVLPIDDPSTVSATGQFLTSDASGNLSFADVDGGTF